MQVLASLFLLLYKPLHYLVLTIAATRKFVNTASFQLEPSESRLPRCQNYPTLTLFSGVSRDGLSREDSVLVSTLLIPSPCSKSLVQLLFFLYLVPAFPPKPHSGLQTMAYMCYSLFV